VNSEVSLGWGWHLAVHDNGWGRHARTVDVHEVPGNHTTMVLEPNVKVLAARLRSTLDAAEASAGLASMRRLMT